MSLVVYLGVRLAGLADYPIYFFTDEAIQTVRAAQLVASGFRDPSGALLPAYFQNQYYFNLSASVYWQVIPYVLFGASVFVTRAAAVLATSMAALGIYFSLRDVFRVRYPWIGVLILSATPAWFLHSRTAFETALMVSFWAPALCFYMLYRCRDARYLFPAIVFAALAFYSYSPGQVVVVAGALLLAIVDAPFHWRNRRFVAAGFLLALLLALPYARFRMAHPEAAATQMAMLSSYWLEPLPLSQKLVRFAGVYAQALSPSYWFSTVGPDLVRHRMGPHPHLMLATAPFLLLGLVLALWRSRREPAYRVLLVAMLAAPAGTALVAIGLTRVLSFVVPATLLATIGVSAVIGWLTSLIPAVRGVPASRVIGVGLFLLLAFANVALTRDALTNGPTWSTDYGLYGMQYGARQLFAAVGEELKRDPGADIVVSPTWANSPEAMAEFFFGDPYPFRFASIRGHIEKRLPLSENTLFVITPDEYEDARRSGKFSTIAVARTLLWPDGRPGFYFAHFRYADNVDTVFATEWVARHRLATELIDWRGMSLAVSHSQFDIGGAIQLFDQNPETLARTASVNPMVVEIAFPSPLTVSAIALRIGSGTFEAIAELTAPDGTTARLADTFVGDPENRAGVLTLASQMKVSRLRLSLRDTHSGGSQHVHLWEIELR